MTAGDNANFIVWVWSTGAVSGSVSVRGSVSAASYLGAPSFPICPSANGVTCKIPALPAGQVRELLASVSVSVNAPAASHVQFTAQASASGARSFSASATDAIVPVTSPTALNSTTVVPPLIEFPAIPATGVSPINPSELFPTVSPSPDNTALGLPPAKARPAVHAADVASTVPIDARLIGAQILGLAVLAGAVTMAIARLSLRRSPPGSTASAASPPADENKT